MEEKKILTKEDVVELFKTMPSVSSIVTYGSAWFPQGGAQTKEKKTYDLIVLIDEAQEKWHKKNFELNQKIFGKKKRYSFVGKKTMIDDSLPPKFIHKEKSEFEKNFSCMYFNYNENIELKTLIVSKNYAINMLKSWEQLSIPARFQKETSFIGEIDEELAEVVWLNHIYATICALLMHEEPLIPLAKFNETRTNLSYIGDIRMKTGAEDPDKSKNISEKSSCFFEKLYNNMEFIKIENGYVLNPYDYSLVDKLPPIIKEYIFRKISCNDLNSIRKEIYNFFEEMNAKNSAELTARCFWTNGITTSLQVVIGKFKKMIHSKLYKTRKPITIIEKRVFVKK